MKSAVVVLAVITQLSPCARAAESVYQRQTTLSLLQQQNILFFCPWDVDNEALFSIVLKAPPASSENLPTRTLVVYKGIDSSFEELINIETPDSPTAIFQSGSSGNLITLWEGGSAYHIRVLAFAELRVKEVLYSGAEWMPEIVQRKDGSEAILLRKRMQGVPMAEVYVWHGTKYKYHGALPWDKRFEVVVGNP